MFKRVFGFTIVEILIAVSIIATLSVIAVMSFSKILITTRDSSRSAKITSITNALEEYYQEHGEYPSCNEMSQSAEVIATDLLKGIKPEDLIMPGATPGVSSILPSCTDLTDESDVIAYVGDTGSACLTDEGSTATCTKYTLKYNEEKSDTIVSVESRYSYVVAPPAAPTDPTVTVVLNGVDVQATITPVSCLLGTAEYGIRNRTNDGTWSSYTAWSVTLTASQVANDGVKYGYQAQARCYVDTTRISDTVTNIEATYIDPISTPSAPVVTTNTVGNNTTWSWGATSCASDTSARYQYVYSISPSGYNSGTLSTIDTSVTFATDISGQTYTVATQAQCYNINASSGWSDSGSANYFRPKSFLKLSKSDATTICAIGSDYKPYCWGEGTYGALGNGGTANINVPVAVTTSGVLSGKNILDISTGNNYSCVIADDYQAYCWGRNNSGQLGDNSTTNRSVPVAVYTSGVLSGKTLSSIWAGGGQQTCVLASDNWVYCWGAPKADATYGPSQLGNGGTSSSKVPVAIAQGQIPAGVTIKYLEVGYSHACVVGSDDLAYCWGENAGGQLGNNSTTDTTSPVAVNMTSGVSALYGKTVKSISPGDRQTCAIASDDKVYCWGNSAKGEVGIGTTGQTSVPAAVVTTGVLSGKNIVSVHSGDSRTGFLKIVDMWGHTCALATDGWLYCWGYNEYGQNADNTMILSLSPIATLNGQIPIGNTIINVGIGWDLLCVIDSDYQAYCCGDNAKGQLGIGTSIVKYLTFTKVHDLP